LRSITLNSLPSFLEFKGPAMGGEFIYKVFPQSQLSTEEVTRLVQEAHAEVVRIEKKFTEFHPSIVTEINDNAGEVVTYVDDESLWLLTSSRHYADASQGVFDITFAAYGQKWRESLKEGVALSNAEKSKLRALVNYRELEINSVKKTVFLRRKGMKLSLGGIGKGYAVDRAYDLLRNKGLVNFSVNGSGDIRVHSHSSAPRPWKVGIRNPFSKDPNQSAGLVQLTEGSVSTSGSYIQFNKNGNKHKDHHILSSYSEGGLVVKAPPVSVTVFSDTSMDSDVWGTICMAVDVEKGLEFLNSEGKSGVLIDSSGKTHLTKKAIKNFKK